MSLICAMRDYEHSDFRDFIETYGEVLYEMDKHIIDGD